MAICSYQTLARYDECSHGLRARCTADIRRKQREAWNSIRRREKCLRTVMNRKSFATLTLPEPDFGSSYDEVDFQQSHDSSLYDENQSYSWSSPSRSDAASPSPSCNSDYSALSVSGDRRGSIYELMAQAAFNESKVSKNSKSRKELLLSRKTYNQDHYDIDHITREYDTLKLNILRFQNNSQVIDDIVRSGWQTLAKAVGASDRHISQECTEFVSQLISSQIVGTETILFVFQQGLIFSLRDSMSVSTDQYVRVVSLFITLFQHAPQSMAYVIELMSSTHMLQIINESFSMGTSKEVHAACAFNNYCLQVTLGLIQQGSSLRPIIPSILITTGVTPKILESYSPQATLKRLIRPNLTEPMVMRFFKQVGAMDHQILTMVSRLMSYCLMGICLHLQSPAIDRNWCLDNVQQLEQLELNPSLEHLSKAYSQDSQLKSDLVDLLAYHRLYQRKVALIL